ncbi:MAG: GxxExxY protein [candidate division WOR-3 bacterium]|nr:GxxExxY protein [candidate division WOR-3 bacterium]
MENRDPLTERIIGCCFKVHKELEAGFNEKIYHNALKLSFDQEELRYQTEKELSVFYLDKLVGNFRVDLIVEDKVVVEVKSLAGNIPIYLSVDRQFLSLNYFLI